jgi:pyruvate/2-oxoglutarate dehydrogenase complex dihydrolipoamide acyltransferase (E2) component
MTDISNSDDVIDSRDVIARIEELEDSRKPWAAGWNMPGYMPDSEPCAFASWEEARDYLVAELERAADEAEEETEEATDYAETAARFAGLPDESEVGETVGAYHWWIGNTENEGFESAEEQAEHRALKALADEASGYAADWEYGETLIRDSYFKEYAQELADDIGAINRDATWPNDCIDWDRAARELQMDYTSVDFAGVTYWVR